MYTLTLLIHIITCIVIVFFVLLQSGQGDAGGMFGGGGNTNSAFGGAGPATFLAKVTAWAGALFFVTSLLLTSLSSQRAKSIVDQVAIPKPAAHAVTETTQAATSAVTNAVTGTVTAPARAVEAHKVPPKMQTHSTGATQ